VLIPGLADLSLVFANDLAQPIQLARLETSVSSERGCVEPELAQGAISSDVNMRRLVAIEAVEKEAIRPRGNLDRRHRDETNVRTRR
jgi:hypothetical protein